LTDLRRAGLYTLAGAEGRHGLTDEEMDAGILDFDTSEKSMRS
jgi:hypothetical protein